MDPERTAALLAGARLAGRPVTRLADSDRPRDLSEAYAVQAARLDFMLERSPDSPSGWKVGATTASMQRYLGVDGPAYARMLRADTLGDGIVFTRAELLDPGIECEIAVRIACDAGDAPYDRGSVSSIVGEVLPAIEIVENRYDDFAALGAPTLVADNFFHRACVLGEPAGAWCSIDLAAVRGRTMIDGEERGAGLGAEAMGHPFEVVAWLANTLRSHGRMLRAGEIVMTGSVAPVIWLGADESVATVALDGLGEVSARFA